MPKRTWSDKRYQFYKREMEGIVKHSTVLSARLRACKTLRGAEAHFLNTVLNKLRDYENSLTDGLFSARFHEVKKATAEKKAIYLSWFGLYRKYYVDMRSDSILDDTD